MFDKSAFNTAASSIREPHNQMYVDVMSEAADEIEKLRSALSEIAAYPWRDHSASYETAIIAGIVSTAANALTQKETIHD